jgi:hypothetical protein
LIEKLTPAQVRVVKLLEKHRVPGTGKVKWAEIQKELPECWASHVIRQQVQFALYITGSATVDELVQKYKDHKEAKVG